MRQLTQFVAILMVCLVAVLPAMAGLPCTAGMHANCAPGCPMATSGMGADCPMANQMAAGNCLQDCCAKIQPQAVVLPAVVTKLNFGLPGSQSAVSAATFAARTDFALWPAVSAEAASPPLYLLNQVFRI